jgi:UDP-N-acetylglucosamine 1-carboxyvinyltransferase
VDMFVIEGGKALHGTVRVGGSKNAALPIIAAALMIDGEVTLTGLPDLVDIRTMKQLLLSMEVRVDCSVDDCIVLCRGEIRDAVAPYELVRQMRASVCVLGPLVARTGSARVSLPGGCNIGHRPIDLHLKGLAALGADVRLERGYVFVTADRLTGADIDLVGPHGSTVTGTCNLMMAASLARGTSVIRSAAREPEVSELAGFLNKAGARVQGAGSETIEIAGVAGLSDVQHAVSPDRIEAATLAAATLITHGRVHIENAPVAEMGSVIEALTCLGAKIEAVADGLLISSKGDIHSHDFEASPYPGIPTDVQAQLMAVLAVADGTSQICDLVFPDRFMHAAELNRMGADITVQTGNAVVRGVSKLCNSQVMASDLRASAALVIAALAAEGRSEVHRVYHLDRGYESFEKRLNSLGASVVRTDDRALPVCLPKPHIATVPK